ncbi:hypothetical protein BBJ28_00011328 [Nothophytophthora sp. Chile5]|nr:hypothetical protein BBJ28_00011328 [Nothophytophthora sp. Chile5]
MWLVLPLLLDVQPFLLRVDVRRHVPAQLQLFCREHGLETTRCAGVLQEALENVVNFQRFCKTPGAEEALPGFMVAKNVLRDSETPGSVLWRQDGPENIAVDLCSFVQQSVGVDEGFETAKCEQAIEKALALSFEWMLALTPCEASSSELEAPDVLERLSIVERMIAALDFSVFKEGELPTSSFTEEETSDDLGLQSIEEGDTVAQSADSDLSASNPVEQGRVDAEENENAVNDLDTEVYDASVGVVTDVDMEKGSTGDDESTEDDEVAISGTQNEITVNSTEETFNMSNQGQDDEQVETAPPHGVEAEAPTKTEEQRSAVIVDDIEDSESSQDTISPKQVDTENFELANRSRDTAYATLERQQLDQLEGELQSKKSWTVVVTLVLLLSIAYLCIDLLLIGVRRVASSLAKPQLYPNLLLQDVFLFLRGGQQSRLNSSESSGGPLGPRTTLNATERLREAEQPVHEDATSSESRGEELGSTTASSGSGQLLELEQPVQEEGEDLSDLQLPDASTSSPEETLNSIDERLNADRLPVPEDLEGNSESASSSEAEVDTHDDDVITSQVSPVAVSSSAEHLNIVEQFVSEMEEQQLEPLSPTLGYGTGDDHLESPNRQVPEEQDVLLESQVPSESTTPSDVIPTDIQEQTEPDNDAAVAVPEPESTIILHAEAALPSLRSAPLYRSRTPSFTCVAMALMVGKHASFFHKTATTSAAQLSFGHQGLPTPRFLQSGREIVDFIRQKHQRELAAARRIQHAWFAIRRRDSSVQAHETGVRLGMLPTGFVRSKIKASASIFSLLSLQRQNKAQTRRSSKPAGGFHRLVSNALPPL